MWVFQPLLAADQVTTADQPRPWPLVIEAGSIQPAISLANVEAAFPRPEQFVPQAWETFAGASVQSPASAAQIFQGLVPQAAPPPVVNQLAFLPSGVQTFIELRGRAQTFLGDQGRIRDLLGAVQVVESYGFQPPLTVVQAGPALADQGPPPPPVEIFPAWVPRTAASVQALTSSAEILQSLQVIENFYPQGWVAEAGSVQPPALRAVLLQVVEPQVERFNPRYWPQAGATTFLAPVSRSGVFHVVEPIADFFPQAWRVTLTTAIGLTSSTETILPTSPPVEVFYPQGRQILVATALAARSFTATYQLVREPEAVVVATPTLPWSATVQTAVELKSRAATFQLITRAVEVFYPQARQAAVVTAVQPGSSALTFLGRSPVQAFFPQAWPTAAATVLEPRGKAVVFHTLYEVRPAALTPATTLQWIVRTRSDIDQRASAATFLIGQLPPFFGPPVSMRPGIDGGRATGSIRGGQAAGGIEGGRAAGGLRGGRAGGGIRGGRAGSNIRK